MSASMSTARLNLRRIFSTQCELRKLVEATRIHQHRNNPDGGDLLESNLGRTYEILGDVVRVSKCRNITNFVIIWSRRWQGHCYSEFPTNISNMTGTHFVDIHTRRLVKVPSKIPCDKMPRAIYIRSPEGVYFEVTRQGLSRRTKLKFNEDHLISEVNINMDNNWDSFETEDKVPTASILEIIQRARLSMIDVTTRG